MIEIATAKTALDVFRRVLEIFDLRKTRKREFFERTCQPIYETLKPLAKEYYRCIHDALSELEKENPDLPTIVRNLRSKRAALVIDRNSIVADARDFEARFYLGANDKIKKAELPSYRFGYAVFEYFYTGFTSALTAFVEDIEKAQIDMQGVKIADRQEILQELQESGRTSLCALEARWTNVAESYSRLRPWC